MFVAKFFHLGRQNRLNVERISDYVLLDSQIVRLYCLAVRFHDRSVRFLGVSPVDDFESFHEQVKTKEWIPVEVSGGHGASSFPSCETV